MMTASHGLARSGSSLPRGLNSRYCTAACGSGRGANGARAWRAALLLTALGSTVFGQFGASSNGAPSKSVWLGRLRVLQAEQVVRFNYMDRGPGVITDRDVQYRLRARLQINLAGSGTTYLRLRAENGRGFDNSWDNTGLGRGEGRWNFHVKSLALGHRLSEHAEVQVGGIEFDQGAGTQHTYASGDGHLVGYRLVVSNSDNQWLPRKAGVTLGYAGDFHEPSVFSRFRLGRLNYAQFLAQDTFGRNGEWSAQIDVLQGVWLTRQAARWRHVWRPVVDELGVEAVTRTTHDPSFGWSVNASRPIDRAERWRGSVIYTHIPKGLYHHRGIPLVLNRGEIDLGKRIAWGGSYAVNPNVELGIFAGRLLDQTPSKRWIAQVYVGYQYADLLNRLLH